MLNNFGIWDGFAGRFLFINIFHQIAGDVVQTYCGIQAQLFKFSLVTINVGVHSTTLIPLIVVIGSDLQMNYDFGVHKWKFCMHFYTSDRKKLRKKMKAER